MMTAILKIVSLVLSMLDRYLEEQRRTRGQRENDGFKENLARRNLDKSADMLSKRLREYKANHPKGQRANRASSDRPK